MKSRVMTILSLVIILGMILTACAPAAPAPATVPPPKNLRPSKQKQQSNLPNRMSRRHSRRQQKRLPQREDYAKADRKDTVIFDIDGGRVTTPDLWNPYVPGNRRDHGLHQAMVEPLFILNYESGKIEPWLGESMTSNDKLDVWTLKLHEGVTWSDGVPMTADDVVFTVQLMMKNNTFGDQGHGRLGRRM